MTDGIDGHRASRLGQYRAQQRGQPAVGDRDRGGGSRLDIGRRLAARLRRHVEQHCRSAVRRRLDLQGSARAAHDALDKGEPQPGAQAPFLCREERIEHALA